MNATIRTLAIATITIASASFANAADPSCDSVNAKSARASWPPAIPYVFTGDAAGQTVDPREWAKIWMEDEAVTAAVETKQYLDSLNQTSSSAITPAELEIWALSYPDIDQPKSLAAK
jgi:hypothetical protein